MKQILREELVIDEESLIYKELEKIDKINEFKNQYVDESYDALIEEMKNESSNKNSRHWTWFDWGHIAITGFKKIESYALNLLAIADLTFQIAPAIYMFVKNGDTQALVDAISVFDGRFSSTTKWILALGIEDLRDWKIKTKCKSTFVIWGVKL